MKTRREFVQIAMCIADLFRQRLDRASGTSWFIHWDGHYNLALDGDEQEVLLVDADQPQSVANLGGDPEVEDALSAPALQGVLVDSRLFAVAALTRGKYELLAQAGDDHPDDAVLWIEADAPQAIEDDPDLFLGRELPAGPTLDPPDNRFG